MDLSWGVYLNLGANLGATTKDVFELTLQQATLAEQAGFRDLWVTEHHFIPFGINPSSLTASAFLLGRTQRIRVGTAVTLCPLYHPLELAERAALLDQLSGGRFDLGLGRGGYLKDFEMLERDTARWDDEPLHSAQHILKAWSGEDLAQETHDSGPSFLQPMPATEPHPPMFLATSNKEAIQYAAQRSIPLMHYFATPVAARVAIEDVYRQANPDAQVQHVHNLIVQVTNNVDSARKSLQAALVESFSGGDWPHVPQARTNRHVGPDGKPLSRDDMAYHAAQGAIMGDWSQVQDEMCAFVEETGACRIVAYAEACADAQVTLNTLETIGARMS
ncbi:MAG: LLM class flavin-dependent oxidoreductase [Pseudomonadota bacterium]